MQSCLNVNGAQYGQSMMKKIVKTSPTVAVPAKEGIYVHFEGAPDYNLKIDSLEDKRQGIILFNSTTKESHAPDGIHEV